MSFPRGKLLVGWAVLAALLGTAGRPKSEPRGTPAGGPPRAPGAAPQVAALGLAPMIFEANAGQLRGAGSEHVKFVARGQGYTLFLTATGAVLKLRIQDSGFRNPEAEIRNSKIEIGNSKLENPTSAIENRRSRAPSPESRAPNVVCLKLKGSNPQAKAVGLDELPGKANYFIGDDPERWRANVTTFGRVKLEQIYPGIDAVFYGREGELEYDLVVVPGADPRLIKFVVETGNSKLENRNWKLENGKSKIGNRESSLANPKPRVAGPEAVHIADNGDLVVRAAGGEVRLRRPVVYQEGGAGGRGRGMGERSSWPSVRGLARDATRRAPRTRDDAPRTADHGLLTSGARHLSLAPRHFLECRYVLTGDNQVHFEIVNYDKSKHLIIDPVLSYSTYLGGSGYDYASAIAVDSSGNAYVTGQTDSLDFPVSGAAQPSSGGGTCGSSPDASLCLDVFVTKLSASGSSVVYSTYLGGSGDDRGTGIAVDSSGNAYVTGTTASADFPVANAFQRQYAGGNCGSATTPVPCFEAFVAKLNASGSALAYSTFLGGSGQDLTGGIAVDSAGEATVVGSTSSVDFPTTVGALQRSHAGGTLDAFVTRLVASGSKAVFSTYLGGSGEDRGLGIAVDCAGNAYVAGNTASQDFPASRALQPANAGGTCGSETSPTPCTDAFVAKLNAAGTSVAYSTYLGGTGGDSGNAVAADSSGAAYVAGMTASSDFPVTSGAYQWTGGGVSVDAFVAKIQPDGSSLAYSTYLGGIGQQAAYGIALDSAGQAYVTGYVNGAGAPAASPVQAGSGGLYDAFLAKLNAAGSDVIFSTYLGGSGNETGQGIAVDSAGNAYLAGGTISVDFPVTSAFQAVYGGGSYDAFAAKISGLKLPVARLSQTSITFPGQGVGTTSAPIPVLLANDGDAPLGISRITLSGDFSQNSDCASTIQPAASCTLQVSFAPSAYGLLSGTLTISDNAWGNPHVITLAGNGVPSPVVSLSPQSLSFPAQTVGTTSASQAVTLANAGSVTLMITSVSALGDFVQSNNCGTSVLAGAQCAIQVAFAPESAGGAAGQVSVHDNAPGSPHDVTLTGTGTGPAISLSPASLAFGDQKVGTTSAIQSVILSSTGTTTLKVAGIIAAGDFAQANTCGSALAAGKSCTINVRFTPTATGPRTGTLSVTDDAAGSPHQVSLSGNGVIPAVSLSPSALTFADQGVGTKSPPQSVTLTNAGGGALTISALAASGDFLETNDCGQSLAPGAHCTIQLQFVPTVLGERSGTLTVADDAARSPQTVALSGNAVVAFSLSSTPSQQTVLMGTDTTTFLVKADSAYAYTGSIALDCDGNASVQCTFNPAAILPGGASTLTVANLSHPATDSVAFDIQGASENQMAHLSLAVLISDFGLSATNPAVTLSAGQTATFQLVLTPINGFNQTITMACNGAPPRSTCVVSPARLVPSSSGSSNVAVTVTTTARGLAAPRVGSPPESPLGGWRFLIVLAACLLWAARKRSGRPAPVRVATASLLAIMLFSAGCGGGGAGPIETNPGTPAGRYDLKVTGTSGQLVRTVDLSLRVN
jgi:hypothetical protein